MPLTLDQIEAEARRLTTAERADLAQRLFASIEAMDEPDDSAAVERAWIAEAERRYERFIRGETHAVPATEALARVRAGLHRQ